MGMREDCMTPLVSSDAFYWSPSRRAAGVVQVFSFERMRARDDYTGQDPGDAAAASLVRLD